MKRWQFGLVMTLLITLLAGCGSAGDAPAAEDSGSAETYTSAVLDRSYPGALDVSSQLALGTMELEGTADAVTPEQATDLLPLWQALQGAVTAQAEVNAVLAQIEATMTRTQLEAIAALQLTQEDLMVWAEESGLPMPAFGGGPVGRGQGASEEERAAVRATIEAGGAPPGFPSGGDWPSEEERAAFQATMEAGGGMPGGGRPGGAGRGGATVLIGPLVELLTERAAE